MSLVIPHLNLEPGDGEMGLMWDAPVAPVRPVLDYSYSYSEDGVTWQPEQRVGSLTDLTALITGLTNGQNYWFRVNAEDSVGPGPWFEKQGSPQGPPAAEPVQEPVIPEPPTLFDTAHASIVTQVSGVAANLTGQLAETNLEVERLTGSIALHTRLSAISDEFVSAVENSNSVAFNRAGMKLFAASQHDGFEAVIQQSAMALLREGLNEGLTLVSI